jgi:hypothetical protein
MPSSTPVRDAAPVGTISPMGMASTDPSTSPAKPHTIAPRAKGPATTPMGAMGTLSFISTCWLHCRARVTSSREPTRTVAAGTDCRRCRAASRAASRSVNVARTSVAMATSLPANAPPNPADARRTPARPNHSLLSGSLPNRAGVQPRASTQANEPGGMNRCRT